MKCILDSTTASGHEFEHVMTSFDKSKVKIRTLFIKTSTLVNVHFHPKVIVNAIFVGKLLDYNEKKRTLTRTVQ